VLAALLMLVPLAVQSKARPGQGAVNLVAYFLFIGLAYLAAEVAAIQQLSLLLGHPVYAVAAVLATLLICSGAGSAWSDWLALPAGRRACIALAAMLALYGIGLMSIVHGFQSSPLIVRAVVGVTCLAPPAIMMGLPFPFGLRALAGERTVRVAWAWGVNGFASVVATPLAALIALEGGSPMLFLIAAASYAGAAALLPGKQPLLTVARPQPSGMRTT
jgi:MFS family permease